MGDYRDLVLGMVAVSAIIGLVSVEIVAIINDENGAYIAPMTTALGAIVGAVGGYLYGRGSGIS